MGHHGGGSAYACPWWPSEADAVLAAVPGGAPQPGIALDLVHRPDGLAGAVGARLPPPVGGESSDCMEIAASTAAVHIRDSKAAAGPVLAVSRAAWAGFVELAAASEQRG
ncbi:DUF397 domain-containing protein [Streptomyces olivaceus]|uniref:DUF397 domain-containing protein n=1 Tax=Streptomyces olivaceus TaxID=47716 RepID=UPI00357136C2